MIVVNHPGWGAGQWLAMGFMMVIFWGLVIALVLWLVRSAGWGRNHEARSSIAAQSADDVHAQRFARGEIDEPEFSQRRAALHPTSDRYLPTAEALTMAAYLPWLIFLACPLMMMFMMRGLGGGRARSDPPGKETGGQALTPEEQTRIEQLETEVAELRAGGKRRTGGNPPSRRMSTTTSPHADRAPEGRRARQDDQIVTRLRKCVGGSPRPLDDLPRADHGGSVASRSQWQSSAPRSLPRWTGVVLMAPQHRANAVAPASRPAGGDLVRCGLYRHGIRRDHPRDRGAIR